MSLEVHLEGRIEEVAEAVAGVRRWAEDKGLPAETGRKLAIAADELLNNIVFYGFQAPGGHDIRLQLEYHGAEVSLTLSDDGIPFDPLAPEAPDTTETAERRRIGGLGIHLVRKMMDEVAYRRERDRNYLQLVLGVAAD